MAWRYNDLTTLASAPAVGGASVVDGYVTTFNNQQHVNFVTNDGHVHELYYDNAWHHNDLTDFTGAPAAFQSALAGYETSFNSQQHVVFFRSNHVHELYYDGAWHHNDLTDLSGAPNASENSEIQGYQTAFNSQHHVIFFTDDAHVHELYYDGTWHHNDLTTLAGAPNAVVSNDVDGLFDAYVTTFNNQQHINFSGVDGHIHELYYDVAWHHNDLTAITGAPKLVFESPLAGYQTSFNKQQHVIFTVGIALSSSASVHELYYDGAWHHNDLTTLADAPDAEGSTSQDGYETSFNNQQHINFFDINSHVHELYYDSAWHNNDLTILAGAPNAVGGSSLVGYQTAFNQQQHVIFEVLIGTALHIYELYYTG